MEENGGNGRPDWQTPGETARHIVRRFGITYDAFASHENAIVDRYSTIEGTFMRHGGSGAYAEGLPPYERISDEDGLARAWTGERTFFNPPYSHGWGDLLAAKVEQERERAALMVGLLMADTSTIFWRDFVIPNAEAITYLPRVRYVLTPEALEEWREKRAEAERAKGRSPKPGKMPDSPNFGSAVVIFRGADYPVGRNRGA